MDSSLAVQLVIAGATLSASLGGYWLAGMNEAIRDRRTADREDRTRRAELNAKRVEETRAFQRETLLALQDAVQAMARLNGRLVYFDHMEARSGRYNSQLPATLDDETRSNGALLLKLNTRVLDPEVRQRVLAFNSYSSGLALLGRSLTGLSGGELESRLDDVLLRAIDEYSQVMEPLGEAIRRELGWQPPAGEPQRVGAGRGAS